MGGQAVDPLAAQPNAAGGRPLQPDDELQERALAGPVRTDDGDDVAVVDPERHAVDGRETAEALRDLVNLEEQIRLHGYDGGRYGVNGGDLNITLGQKVVEAVFNPASGGAPLVRMAYCGRGSIISPHAVHRSGHA